MAPSHGSLSFPSAVLVLGLIIIGCRHHRPVAVVTDCLSDGSSEPLLPTIRFREPTTAGTVTALLLDGHSGSAIMAGYIHVLDSQLLAYVDSTGRASLQGLPPGHHVLETRALSYYTRRDTLVIEANAGLALVIQLRRAARAPC